MHLGRGPCYETVEQFWKFLAASDGDSGQSIAITFARPSRQADPETSRVKFGTFSAIGLRSGAQSTSIDRVLCKGNEEK